MPSRVSGLKPRRTLGKSRASGFNGRVKMALPNENSACLVRQVREMHVTTWGRSRPLWIKAKSERVEYTI